ncbi:response regulator transcription factor [Nocardioides luti]|uniref:response regulator transcription factor n=1 Tax=Nocardioides luti TaxID=2761101 RepID=UPI001C88F1B7|nr:response regulator transcription factor [Nocardioides luti]
MSLAPESALVPPKAVVIEDDPEVAHLLLVILTQAGFDVRVAHDGPSGVEAVRSHEPVVTTVDVALPGFDGFEATRRIRSFSETYIVMVSALTAEADILGGFAAGADDYVGKPFRPRELRSRFMAGLRRPQRRVAHPSYAPPEPVRPARTPYAGPVEPVRPAPPTEPAPAPVAEPAAPVPAPRGGVEFAAEWIHFRGLDLNPGRGELVVDGAPVDLQPLEFDLLEILLYSGEQVRSAADLALSLRGETYRAGSPVLESDRLLVNQAMSSLLTRLGEHRPDPRWIELTPAGYRLVSP